MDTQTSLEFLWNRKWIVLATLALTVVATIVLTLRTPKTYEASSLVQAVPLNSANTDPGSLQGVQQASQGLASTYATLIDSPGFLEHIRPLVMGGGLSLSQLQSRVGADVVSVNSDPTNLIKLTATGPSPTEAKQLAADVGHSFVTSIRNSAEAQVNDQVASINRKIASLNSRIRGLRNSGKTGEELTTLVAARDDLTTQQVQLITNGIARAGDVRVAAQPSASSTAVSPRPLFNVVVGVFLGLLAGIGLAWFRERLDVGLHDADDVEKILDIPNLATIPMLKGSTVAVDEPTSEAYDVLRTNLVFLGVDRPLQVLTFTSFNPGEGKSSVVKGLARAAHRAGSNVLIVDCDLRTGSLSQRLVGKNEMPGLTNLIVADAGVTGRRGNGSGRTGLSDVIVPLAKGLALLPAGPLPPNPTGLLSSKAIVDLIRQVRGDYDLILIDSPPVAHLADASLLASVSDGVALVARVGLTKRQDLTLAAASLRHTPTPIIGSVVFERRSATASYYPAPTRERMKPSRQTITS
jgi:capsular exopolysaccharide synthesis family protein